MIIYQTTLAMQRSDKTYLSTLCIASASYHLLSSTYSNFLHPDELFYYHSLKFEKRQHSYLLGRYCAKQALSLPPFCIQPTTCSISSGIFSQPILWAPHHDNIHVCISHAQSIGIALAFPEAHPMGVDIEKIDPSISSAMKNQMSVDELKKQYDFILPEINLLTLQWSVKEALSKIIRTGLMISFELLELDSIIKKGAYFYSTFKHFSQYQACSFMYNNHFCSIVYPKNTIITFDLAQLL